MGRLILRRPIDKHLDSRELDALVPSLPETGQLEGALSLDAFRDALRHVAACQDCEHKVNRYRSFINRARQTSSHVAPPARNCEKNEGIDWNEVLSGQWPEFRVRQLILHAAMCDLCGPQLRAAVSSKSAAEENQTEKKTTASAPTIPASEASRWRFMRLLAPVFAVLLMFSVAGVRYISGRPVSGEAFAALAAGAHRDHAQGKLALQIHSDSRAALNQWLRSNLKFRATLPDSPTGVAEKDATQFEGARLVEVGGKPAAYVAYRTETGPASLVVTTDSVADASGGSVADYKKVSFHYTIVEGYKVVTWTQHGLTYALVSQEGNETQQSCMVCHSAMGDRDLTHTPTPLHKQTNSVESLLQKL